MTMQRTPLLMHRILGRGALLSPDEEVVSLTPDGLHRQTLAQTATRARKLASALAAAGVEPGDRVASMMWNHHRHLEMYLAVPSMGSVLHTLHLRLSLPDLESLINHARDRVIVLDDDLFPPRPVLHPALPSLHPARPPPGISGRRVLQRQAGRRVGGGTRKAVLPRKREPPPQPPRPEPPPQPPALTLRKAPPHPPRQCTPLL
mgnify:CR=1 FL=1